MTPVWNFINTVLVVNALVAWAKIMQNRDESRL